MPIAIRKKRGRPRQERVTNDQGTPELQRKRTKGETSEPLDLCLKRELITDAQHQAGRTPPLALPHQSWQAMGQRA